MTTKSAAKATPKKTKVKKKVKKSKKKKAAAPGGCHGLNISFGGCGEGWHPLSCFFSWFLDRL